MKRLTIDVMMSLYQGLTPIFLSIRQASNNNRSMEPLLTKSSSRTGSAERGQVLFLDVSVSPSSDVINQNPTLHKFKTLPNAGI